LAKIKTSSIGNVFCCGAFKDKYPVNNCIFKSILLYEITLWSMLLTWNDPNGTSDM